MSTIHDHTARARVERLVADSLLTMDQAAARMGVTVRMVRRLTSERRLAFVKVGKHVRIPTSAVEGFIAAGYVPALRSPEPRVRRDQAYGIRTQREVASS
jgi:excisionase family DNA binding protein